MKSYFNTVLRSKETAGTVVDLFKYKATQKKAKFEEVRKKLASVGIDIKITGNKRAEGDTEYRVNLKNGREATAYYATDLNDALQTGMGLSAWSEDASSVDFKDTRLPILIKTLLSRGKQ